MTKAEIAAAAASLHDVVQQGLDKCWPHIRHDPAAIVTAGRYLTRKLTAGRKMPRALAVAVGNGFILLGKRRRRRESRLLMRGAR